MVRGVINLEVKNPKLAREWHPTRNGKLTPKDVLPNSGRKVWWKCKKGHVWRDKISDRNRYNLKCPGCGGYYKKKVFKYNCLASLRPDLAREWHQKKNGDLTPRDIRCNSGRKVWWKCRHGHEWTDTVCHRTNGRGCPGCSGRMVTDDNCLAARRPDLTKQWHPTKNDRTPWEVTPGMNYKAWWKCDLGHVWQATVVNRNKGRGCPECWENRRKSLRIKKL